MEAFGPLPRLARPVVIANKMRARACATLPSWRGESGAASCEAAGPEKPGAYSLEYVEDFFGPSTTQMVADLSPQ
jgi:hypothetical protein